MRLSPGEVEDVDKFAAGFGINRSTALAALVASGLRHGRDTVIRAALDRRGNS
jgi:hypothetical protein